MIRTSECSRCHPVRAAIPPFGKEIGELVADDLHLTEHEVTSRFEADKPRAGDALLSRDEVSGHDFVYGELLIGDKGGRKQLLDDYEQMHQAPVVSHRDVVEFVRHRRLHGRGIGWIDAHLLASALVGRLRLWTTNPALATAAKELGIAYE